MCRFLPAVVALAAVAAPAAAGPYDELLKSVPPNTNTIALVNVKAALASPLSKGEKWSDEHWKRYQSGIGFVPPEADVVVVASDVNLSDMSRVYQVGLIQGRNVPTVGDVARREGGTVDDVNGQIVVLSPRDAYFTNLPGQVLAAVHPANRQALARWLRAIKSGGGTGLSPYLARAAAEDATVVVAVDLTDSVDPKALRLGLPASPAVVKQKGVDVGLVSAILASVRGLTFTATVTDRIVGTVRIDFGLEIERVKRITRELFLELLDGHGVTIPGMNAWETTYGDKSMTLTGPMTTADLRRVLSLFSFPGPAGEDDPKATPGAPTATGTQRYLGAVNTILADIRGTKDSPDYTKTATWHEKAADQLEQLGRRAVDPIAVEAAYEAAKRLRAIAGSLRGVPIDLEAIAKTGYYYSRPNYGVSVGWWGIRPVWYGGSQVETNLPQVRAEQAKVVAADQHRRAEMWSQIDRVIAEARRRLTEKYKTMF